MKNHYELSLNCGRKTAKPVIASFGRNKDIRIYLSAGGAYIETDSSGLKDASAVLAGEDPLFSDIIRKTLLLYVLRYERHLEIKRADFLINGKSAGSYDSNTAGKPLVYCLHEGKLRIPFGQSWRDETVVRRIATTSKSNYSYLLSSLHALLAAKSDHYETERFTYYWMSMNALYSWLYAREKEKKGREFEEQTLFLEHYGYDYVSLESSLTKKERERREKKILDGIKAVLKRIPDERIDDFCSAVLRNDDGDFHVQQVLSGLKNDKEAYEYTFPIFSLMLIWVPYKVRCASFHAEAAIPTYCFEKDRDLQVIRVLNRILDSFLTEQLACWIKTEESEEERAHV